MSTQVQDNITSEKEIKQNHPALAEIPIRLVQQGVISSEDWLLLTDDQKKHILESHGINPDQYISQYEAIIARNNTVASGDLVAPLAQVTERTERVAQQNPTEAPAVTTNPQSTMVERQILPTVEQDRIKKEFESIKSEVVNSEKQIVVNKGSLAPEAINENMSAQDRQRIATERALNQNAGVPKFFGYQPSQQVATNAVTIASSNPVSDGSTWVASLLRKILLSFK